MGKHVPMGRDCLASNLWRVVQQVEHSTDNRETKVRFLSRIPFLLTKGGTFNVKKQTYKHNKIKKDLPPSKALRDKVIDRDGEACFYCSKALQQDELSLDHVMPLSHGGKSVEENLVVCCKDCNLKAGNHPFSNKLHKKNFVQFIF
jgi:5-methylcytosine-specific restriction endonuclease McrA